MIADSLRFSRRGRERALFWNGERFRPNLLAPVYHAEKTPVIVAGFNIADMEPIVMAYVRKYAPEGIWEDEGWGGFDTLGFLEGETNHPNQETGESGYLWQTDIPSSDPDFERGIGICF